MKVDLDEVGILNIRAETPIESYALNRWADDNFTDNLETPHIVIHTRIREVSENTEDFENEGR